MVSSPVTAEELADFARRQQAALYEAGRPELADHTHACVWPDGTISLSFTPRSNGTDPDVDKAVSIDPKFELGT